MSLIILDNREIIDTRLYPGDILIGKSGVRNKKDYRPMIIVVLADDKWLIRDFPPADPEYCCWRLINSVTLGDGHWNFIDKF